MGKDLTDRGCFNPKMGVDYRRFNAEAEHAGDVKLWRQEGDENETPHTNVPHAHVYHSPDGFDWSYAGSGPAELALNILALFLEPPEAWRLHQLFKWAVIPHLPRMAEITLGAHELRAWIEHVWAHEKQLGLPDEDMAHTIAKVLGLFGRVQRVRRLPACLHSDGGPPEVAR